MRKTVLFIAAAFVLTVVGPALAHHAFSAEFDQSKSVKISGEITKLDGLSVDYDDWHFNVRPSNTEPLLRLNLEAKEPRILEKMLAQIAPLLGTRADH